MAANMRNFELFTLNPQNSFYFAGILENKRLLQEIKYSKKKWSFIAYVITSIVIPVTFFIYTQYANERERLLNERQFEVNKKEIALKDIEIKIKLLNFFLVNYEQVFSKDTTVVHNISQVFAVFPSEYTTELFDKIKVLSSEQNKQIWEAREKIAQNIEGIDATIDYYNNDYKLKSILEQAGYTVNSKASAYNNINTIWCSKNTDIEVIKNLADILNAYGSEMEVITYFKSIAKNNRYNYFTVGDHANTEKNKVKIWNNTTIKAMTLGDIK